MNQLFRGMWGSLFEHSQPPPPPPFMITIIVVIRLLPNSFGSGKSLPRVSCCWWKGGFPFSTIGARKGRKGALTGIPLENWNTSTHSGLFMRGKDFLRSVLVGWLVGWLFNDATKRKDESFRKVLCRIVRFAGKEVCPLLLYRFGMVMSELLLRSLRWISGEGVVDNNLRQQKCSHKVSCMVIWGFICYGVGKQRVF